MKVLITGGAGFIGSHLAQKLLDEGHFVAVLDSLHNNYSIELKRNNLNYIDHTAKKSGSEFKFFHTDICNDKSLAYIFNMFRPDAVVHLAALPGVRQSTSDPIACAQVNICGTINVLESMRRSGCTRIVFASSSSVYGNANDPPFKEDGVISPISPYAASKAAGEEFCKAYSAMYGINAACVRIFTAYGYRQRPDLAISKFASLMLSGDILPLYNLESGRDYTHIDDVKRGLSAALDWTERELGYDAFNIGSGHIVRLNEVIDALSHSLNIINPTTKLLQAQLGDVIVTCADTNKAYDVLGYKAHVSFESGIDEFARQYIRTFK